MTPFVEALDTAIARHRPTLVATVVSGLLLGFGLESSEASPGVIVAAGIYLGSFITLYLCSRVVAGAYRDVGTTLATTETTVGRLYLRDLSVAVALAWTTRVLMALALAPYQVGAPGWVFVDPIMLGWPLDLLLVTITLSLMAVLGRGGAVLAFALVFVAGVMGDDASVAPLLRGTRFPWMEIRGVPSALANARWGEAVMGSVRLVAYWLVWLGMGIGALAFRARRAAGTVGDSGAATEAPEGPHP